MSTIIARFVRRLKRIGIDVQLSLNTPWVYLHSVNNQVLMGELFHSEHGFTAFWLPVRLDQVPIFTDRHVVFAKVREYVMKDKEFNVLLDEMVKHIEEKNT